MQPHNREVRNLVSGDRDLFGEWLEALKDAVGRISIIQRIDRVEDGNFGDHRFIGGGVWEDIRRAQELWAAYRRAR